MIPRLLALYPRAWRRRYGVEVASLVEELIRAGDTTPARAGFDLAVGAVLAWWRVLLEWGALLAAAAVIVVGGVVAGVVARMPGTGGTGAYVVSHPLGVLFLLAEAGWLVMEVVQLRHGRRRLRGSVDRDGPAAQARWSDQRRFWCALGACVVVTTVVADLAPFVVPVAAIRPRTLAVVIGIVVLLAGIGLRGWSFRALSGWYRSFTVTVSPGQPVIDTGPYRVLRHPGHAGAALVGVGIGVASANWIGLAALMVLPLALILWRTRVEEAALMATLGERYRSYAVSRKRLVPLVW
ncbi:MAG TPA: isoprenylcysteine carboxylmethyltransferase family protein [Pseudonocardiaceae bacterium]|jgi:protein-S-isoprenylcysteine O-methyltransferase Ste14|nr:isoprenylcysteine carboxylmethyltransferase family protein [Pseudonocardiaceae bacterium]